MTVYAGDAAEVVTAAGGLIFDRVGNGWHVDVYLAERADQRPLRILGADTHELSGGSDTAPAEWPDAIVVAAELNERDAQVRNHFGAASRRPDTEVAMWGGDWPISLGAGGGRVEHRLSYAAQAFKVYAMAAAGATPPSVPTESFSSSVRRFTIAVQLLPPS
jgi:hypothetical protein